MPQYTKKPVQIEARLFELNPTPNLSSSNYDLVKWIVDENGQAKLHVAADGTIDAILIWTLEGEMTATPGDYIIKGVAGEFYPCKPDIFAATYDGPVDE